MKGLGNVDRQILRYGHCPIAGIALKDVAIGIDNLGVYGLPTVDNGKLVNWICYGRRRRDDEVERDIGAHLFQNNNVTSIAQGCRPLWY